MLTGAPPSIGQALVPGLVVMAIVYAIGRCSGAHINPAVTLAFALRRAFPWTRVPAYWLVQAAGAVVAAVLLRLLFGKVEHLGATDPHASNVACVTLETVLTFMLVTVIIGTATQHRVVGPNAAIAVGATIAACSLIGKSVSGASMNPARSFGPAVVSGDLGHLWIYLAGPATGAVIAVLVALVIHPRKHEGEKRAAAGEASGP